MAINSINPAKLYRYARAASSLAVASLRNQVYAYKGRIIERFVLFVGLNRSGSTLIGALLNAHPKMVVSHEALALDHVSPRSNKANIVHLILKKDREFRDNFFKGDRRNNFSYWCMGDGYPYVVKNQWQGKYSRLQIIGDKAAHYYNVKLYDHPGLLDSLRSQMKVPVCALFICRNPYDVISTRYLRVFQKELSMQGPLSQFNIGADKPKLDQKIISETLEELAKLAEVVPRFQQREALFSMRHEDFIASPKDKLREVCTFLGVECTEDYLTDCAAIVYSSPHKTRFKVQWTPGQIQEVAAAIKKHPHLEGYAFDAA